MSGYTAQKDLKHRFHCSLICLNDCGVCVVENNSGGETVNWIVFSSVSNIISEKQNGLIVAADKAEKPIFMQKDQSNTFPKADSCFVSPKGPDSAPASCGLDQARV